MPLAWIFGCPDVEAPDGGFPVSGKDDGTGLVGLPLIRPFETDELSSVVQLKLAQVPITLQSTRKQSLLSRRAIVPRRPAGRRSEHGLSRCSDFARRPGDTASPLLNC